jgi:hypothetical protein
MLDQAKLAVVAYAEVVGSNGTSTLTNSGIYTTRLGAGLYEVDLSKNPDGSASQQELNQFSDRDLIVVTPHSSTTQWAFGGARNVSANGAVKNVFIGVGGNNTGADVDFSIVIYRTLTPPVTGGPA